MAHKSLIKHTFGGGTGLTGGLFPHSILGPRDCSRSHKTCRVSDHTAPWHSVPPCQTPSVPHSVQMKYRRHSALIALQSQHTVRQFKKSHYSLSRLVSLRAAIHKGSSAV